jgi:flagellar motor switch protein FliG
MTDKEQQNLAEESASGIIDTLSGAQKAAAILVAIGRPAASRLLKHFSAEDLRKLAGHARTLDPISPLDFEQLVKEFEDSFAEGAPVSEAGQRFEGLLRDTLPQEEVDAVFEERVQPQLVQESVWVQLGRLPVDSLQAYLADQHPQIIAYIVSKLPSDLAARLFVALPPQLRNAVVQRSLHIGNVAPAAAELLEDVLRRDLLGRSDSGPVKAHHGQIANIFNQLDKNEMEELMASLEDLNRDDLNRIKAKLFTFEDIERLSQRARLLLFDEVQTSFRNSSCPRFPRAVAAWWKRNLAPSRAISPPRISPTHAVRSRASLLIFPSAASSPSTRTKLLPEDRCDAWRTIPIRKAKQKKRPSRRSATPWKRAICPFLAKRRSSLASPRF